MSSSDEMNHEEQPLLRAEPSLRDGYSSRPLSQSRDEPEVQTDGPSSSSKRVPTSSTNILFRIAAAMFSFVVLGMMVSTLGVMVPQFEAYYDLSDLQVSSIFLVWPVGYVLAACLNGAIHLKFGQRGIATIGPLFHIILTAIAAFHPPFPALLFALAVGSLGTGILDGSFCAWAGGMENANVVQGFLHGSFSAGAALGPFLAGTMLSLGHLPWYTWYYVLLGASILEAIALCLAFRFEDSARYRATHKQDAPEETLEDPPTGAKPTIFQHTVTWICAAYFLACVGTESAVSGWVVVFMTRVNHASPYLSSLSSSLFWIGQATGRLALGPVTNKLGVRTATTIYLIAGLACEVLFASIRVPAVAAIFIALLGFCLGPLFPAGVVAVTRLLPRELHVSAVSFVVLVGQVGGALLPFALGALADTLGIRVFQVVVFAQLLVTLLIWLAFPRLPPAYAASTHGD